MTAQRTPVCYVEHMTEDDDSIDGPSPRDYIQSLERGMRVLQAFANDQTRPTISELAQTVNLSRPAVRRILLTFEKMGFARQYRREWTLTPRILEIGQGYFTGDSLAELSQPFLQIVAERTHESAAVSVIDRSDVVHIARVEVHRIMRHAIRVGSRLPAHATAMGKILLGGLNDSELHRYFSETTLEAYTPATLSTEAALREQIADAKKLGYSISIEELEPGLIAVAVPIKVGEGMIVGTLSSTSTSIRSSQQTMVKEVVPLLQEAATNIGRAYYLSNRERFAG